ncbi:MAG: arginine--tRNA ligase [Patescibacteria group bacterium]|nr:MAG: arginine--tRNA ligase [Patescibacteria group bacterium]
MYLIEELKTSLAKALSKATGEEIAIDALEYPELSENGDLAFPCFSLAKKLKSAPPKIAGDLAAEVKLPKGFDRVEAKGPYLNFFLDRAELVEETAEVVRKAGEAYGDRKGDHASVMVEYISPNNNKPLHLGHVRNGLIGAALSNLYESQGKKVARALLLNDRGLAIAKAMVAYVKWGNEATPSSLGKKGDHYLGDLYVMYEQAAKKDESLEKEAHDVIRKWEAGDAETRALWKTMSDWCEAGQHETYKRFGFRFDVEYKESEIYQEGKDIVELGLKKGVFKKDETGAVFADLEAYKLPNKIVLRSDGTSLYITQDIFLAKKKFDEGGIDASVYVVGNEQNLHFQQLFKILELLGFAWADKVKHLSYGYVTLPEGRMKSREGTVVDADDLLSALEADAAMEIKQRHATLPDDELVRRAHSVALAAVKFYFLEVDISSDMVYDPKASLSFTGKTGPYLQYMHARIRSLLKKAETETKGEGEGRNLAPEEFTLAFALARFPEAVHRAASQDRPSLVAAHLYETAKAIAALYENAPVLSASKEDRKARLKLLEAAAVVLKRGAELLGFPVPEEM